MSKQPPLLDIDELMHLALHATNNNQPEKAIAYLKKILETDPKHGKAYYLLGALHAEIGMYDRAIEEMSQAVRFEPNLPTAHFQLGLLYVTSARVEEAREAWKPLDKLGEENPLFLFKRGMLHLVNDEFEACIADLNKGISLNDFNPNLNNDMHKIAAAAEQVLSNQGKSAHPQSAPATAGEKTSSPKGRGGKHVLLSAYQQNYEEDKDK
jgi:tetratricopeptide (TPR) repeat protein